MMYSDPFAKCHPLVNFIFFVGAIAFGVTIQHPAYLIAGFVCAAGYYLLLCGKKGWKLILGLLPLFALLTAVNPLFNRQGSVILGYVFGEPYTLETLLYGGAISSVLVIMLLWFGCYNVVMTSDKFTSLFGRVIPSISLLLVMVLRLVPSLLRKAAQTTSALASIGKGVGEQNTKKEKLQSGINVLYSLTAWTLETSVITADSMRSRGYGTGKSTSFQVYRMTFSDWILLAAIVLLILSVFVTALFGGTAAAFTPNFFLAPLNGGNLCGFLAYCFFLSIPTFLHIKEDITWHILRSKI